MAKRRRGKNRWPQILVFALIAVVGFEVINSLGSQLPVMTSAEANLAQAAAPITCTGNTVYVFSTDYSNANPKDLKRGAVPTQFSCPNNSTGSTLVFLQGLTLKPSEVCAAYPPSPNSCRMAVYAVVGGHRDPNTILTEDNYKSAFFQLDSRECLPSASIKQAVNASNCASALKGLKSSDTQLIKGTTYVNPKAQVIIKPSTYSPSFWENLQGAAITGKEYNGVSILPYTKPETPSYIKDPNVGPPDTSQTGFFGFRITITR